MHRGADMAMMQLVMIATAFGLAISLAIEFGSRIQVRIFYAALSMSFQRKAPAQHSRDETIMRSASPARCGALTVVLSLLAFGSMNQNVLSVVAMIVVIIFYLTYVSWVEIQRLRHGRW